MKRSEFEEDLDTTVGRWAYLTTYGLEQNVKNREMALLASSTRDILERVDRTSDFLEKYDRFLVRLDERFGTKTGDCVKALRSTLNHIATNLRQIGLLASQRKFSRIKKGIREIESDIGSIKENLDAIGTLPETIDYERLDQKDWKMIGTPGVHYKTKIFLNYPFRNNDPTKDENQRMIDDYIKPILALLDIESITGRHIKSQDLINGATVELVKDSDGIIGFYTKGDHTSNVDYELAQNENVIAVCVEEGAKAPSMRESRWQIRFDRSDMSYMIIELIRTLSQKRAFRLLV